VTDVPNSSDPQPVPPVPGPERSSLLSSTRGKVILGVVGGIVVLVLLGVLSVFVVGFFVQSSGPSNGAVPAATSGAGRGSATTSSTAGGDSQPITDPPEKPLESTFTFRNIFAPTMKMPTAIPSTTTVTSVKPSDVPTDTLYLESIQTENGEKRATFIWNGSEYTLGNGEALAGTPWKVITVGEAEVEMLYGDTEVTLSVGQGLAK
jgi:hypothetical protein